MGPGFRASISAALQEINDVGTEYLDLFFRTNFGFGLDSVGNSNLHAKIDTICDETTLIRS